MRFAVLTNSLYEGDAVSTHCRLLQQRLRDLGHECSLHAEWVAPEFPAAVEPPSKLEKRDGRDSVLLHQFFNPTPLMDRVWNFKGTAVMMYHNITPPEYCRENPAARISCSRGLAQARAFSSLYAYAVGMSEFSRQDLEKLGFSRTGVFPLLMDLESLRHGGIDHFHAGTINYSGTTLLCVSRIAPNKRQDKLVNLLFEYRKFNPDARLRLVGDDKQHPALAEQIRGRCAQLGLAFGKDVVITGKISPAALRTEYMCADALVSASEHEGYGATLIEGMAMGLPVFAAAHAAVPETLGGAGCLFEGEDERAWAAQMHEVMGSAERRAALLSRQEERAALEEREQQRDRVESLVKRIAELGPAPEFRPRVSVVINTLNRDRWLERCLLSLRRQTYDNFEIVVVNVPSTDGTEEVLSRFAGQVIAGRVGAAVLGQSRNEGIRLSHGELVAFIDDDAVAADDWIERLVQPFRAPSVGAAGGSVLRMHARDVEFKNGIIDREGTVKWHESLPGLHSDWEEGYLNTMAGGCSMLRRSALMQIGGFDERIEYYHDEADIAIRCQAAGWRVEHCPEAVIYHEAAPSNVRRRRHVIDWHVVVKNTLYVALRNYNGPGKARLALQSARNILRQRFKDVRWARTSGHLPMGEYLESLFRISTGLITGLGRGFFGRPVLMEVKEPDSEAFLRYRTTRPKFSVCLLSHELPATCAGGIPTYTLSLARGLRALGAGVHIITASRGVRPGKRDGIWYHLAQRERLEGPHGPGPETPLLQGLVEYSNGVRLQLQSLIAGWDIDLCESPNWDFEGLLTALEHRLPMVVRAHSPMYQVSATQKWPQSKDLSLAIEAEGMLFYHASSIVGSTKAILEAVKGFYGLEGKPAAQVPLGLAISGGSNGRAPGADVTVLFVGRLERRKGIHILLKAVKTLLAEHPEVRFEIVGRDSPGEDGLSWAERFSKEMGNHSAGERVAFRGEISEEELDRSYRSCDVFVAPSLFESFGLIYVEAMARGKPVVACRAGGAPEVVIDNETGLLVEPGNHRELAGALRRLIVDRDLRERLGRAGRERYQQRFTAGIAAKNTLDYYRAVVREWENSAEVVYHAQSLDFRRSSRSEIVWDDEIERVVLRQGRGNADTFVYGPYLGLQPGRYRAEFAIWLTEAPEAAAVIGRVDVFNGEGPGIAGERDLRGGDFRAARGRIFDVLFDVKKGQECSWEFRVYSNGHVPVCVNWIRVSKWPPGEAESAAAFLRKRAAMLDGDSTAGIDSYVKSS